MATKKRNTRSSSNAKKSGMPWGLMLLSFAIGAFVMFLLHLKNEVPEDKLDDQQILDKVESQEPTFDFYTILPEMEVLVEDGKNNTPINKPIISSPSENANQAEKNKQYFMIQVGSFKKMTDADAFKARLALLGIESKVQSVSIDNKQTWHRVQVGPVAGRTKADQIQKQLRENGFDPLLMRAKQG